MNEIYDTLTLTFHIMNTLMKKGIISYDEAREIIRTSLPVMMSEDKKKILIDAMVTKINVTPKTRQKLPIS